MSDKKITKAEQENAARIAAIIALLPDEKQRDIYNIFEGVRLVGETLKKSKSEKTSA